uniref:Uncharacterized protein n=1 Tax=Romanomermis culicivorax TaxID=13658 RepID=A0A915J9M7_ROMCU
MTVRSRAISAPASLTPANSAPAILTSDIMKCHMQKQNNKKTMAKKELKNLFSVGQKRWQTSGYGINLYCVITEDGDNYTQQQSKHNEVERYVNIKDSMKRTTQKEQALRFWGMEVDDIALFLRKNHLVCLWDNGEEEMNAPSKIHYHHHYSSQNENDPFRTDQEATMTTI